MKKTILMIGDSWGVPDYTRAFEKRQDHMQFRLNHHIENLLRDRGYKVINCSLNGQSNTRSIELAEMYMDGKTCMLEPVRDYVHNHIVSTPYSKPVVKDDNTKIDLVLWFHTALFRDHTAKDLSYKENLHNIANTVYEKYSRFVKKIKAKSAVIGGQGPVITEVLKKYIEPDFYIEDWRSQLVNQNLPEFNSFGSWDYIKTHIVLSKDEISYFDEIDQLYRNVMLKSNMFFDGYHPGKEAHASLAKTIHKLLETDYI